MGCRLARTLLENPDCIKECKMQFDNSCMAAILAGCLRSTFSSCPRISFCIFSLCLLYQCCISYTCSIPHQPTVCLLLIEIFQASIGYGFLQAFWLTSEPQYRMFEVSEPCKLFMATFQKPELLQLRSFVAWLDVCCRCWSCSPNYGFCRC